MESNAVEQQSAPEVAPQAPEQAPQSAKDALSEQIVGMEQTKRILASLEGLLGEGLFPGGLSERIREGKAYLSFLRRQANQVIENLKKAKHEAKND